MEEAAGLWRLPLAHVPIEGEDAGREGEGERADGVWGRERTGRREEEKRRADKETEKGRNSKKERQGSPCGTEEGTLKTSLLALLPWRLSCQPRPEFWEVFFPHSA